MYPVGEGGESLSLWFSSCGQTQSPGLCQDRWQMSCLEVTGDPIGSSFTPHSVSQDATCAATLPYTSTSKEGLTGCSHRHLDGNKQWLTKRRKFRRGPISGRTELWLTIFFRSLAVVSLRFYLLWATFPVWLRSLFLPLLLLLVSCVACTIIIIATALGGVGRGWRVESNRAGFKFFHHHGVM